MRTKLLRGREGVTVQLVYSLTIDEYRQALDALGGSAPVVGNGDLDSVPAGSKPGHAAYMVTTAQQRRPRETLQPLDPRTRPRSVAALRSVIRGHAWNTGLWSLLAALDTVCRKVARRRTDGETSKAVITPETVAEILGAPTFIEADVADLHVHAQSAVEQKDGASAGVALVAVLVSSFTGRPVRADVAMTGEITLSGHILPVAGIKEKVLGACRRGLTHVVPPRENEKHFEQDVGDDVRSRITVHYVRRVDELLDLVLLPVEPAGDRPLESIPSPQVRL